jgi:hypothetical protein
MPFTPPPQLKSSMFGVRGPAGPKLPGTAKPKGPKGIRIENRVGIQAPAQAIWEVIYDVSRWHEWNPLYPAAAGQIRLGSTLDLTLALPGEAPRQIQPVVLEWVPNEQLHWRLSLMGGMVKSIRFIEIEQLAEESCIVSNGELFSGLMAVPMLKRVGRSVHRGFREMGEALKARAEAEWRAQKG